MNKNKYKYLKHPPAIVSSINQCETHYIMTNSFYKYKWRQFFIIKNKCNINNLLFLKIFLLFLLH